MSKNRRIEDIQTLKNNGIIVYSDWFTDSANISMINDIEKVEISTATNVSEALLLNEENLKKTTSWRILSLRDSWKMMFMNIFDHTGNIQLAFKTWEFSFDSWKGEFEETINIDNEELNLIKFLKKYIKVWDFIWVEWKIFENKRWQIVLAVTKFNSISNSLSIALSSPMISP